MFTPGAAYPRSRLLDYVGSRQARSGIIWGQGEPGCLVCTSGGRHSREAGYGDTANADGSWFYFGQGTRGNQDPGRAGNRMLVEGSRSVLLFSTTDPHPAEIAARGSRAKLYRFEGVFGVGGWEHFVSPEGHRAGDRLLRFHLVPASDHQPPPANQLTDETPRSLEELRRLVLQRGGRPVHGTLSVAEYRRASHHARTYVLARARGQCEVCSQPAPFLDAHGDPYLEAHHIWRLADDGPDLPSNVVALCPNCHRAAHHAEDMAAIRERCVAVAAEQEARIAGRLAR